MNISKQSLLSAVERLE